MATLLPTGEQTFFDANGAPLAGGKVYFYIPGTTTPKDTWQDAGQTTLNTNPVILDSAGRAIIYGAGAYRQVLKDSVDNVIWDQLTSDTSSSQISWGGTSSGTANAQAVSASNFSFASGQQISFQAAFTNNAALTLNVNSSGPQTVYADTASGPAPLIGGEVVAGSTVQVMWDDAINGFHLLNGPVTLPQIVTSAYGNSGANKLFQLGSSGAIPSIVTSVSAGVATNALTVSLAPCSLDFRSTTLSDGSVTRLEVPTTLSLTVPATATLGTLSGVQATLMLLALSYSGAVELAIANVSGGINFDESGLVSTTAMSTSATSATVIYSQTARTNVAFRIVGFITISEVTAGTWATAPITVQGIGGQAVTHQKTLGMGQTLQNVTASRAPSTTYYNTTQRPIWVNISMNGSNGGFLAATVNSIQLIGQYSNTTGNVSCAMDFIVPPGGSYSCAMSTGVSTLNTWKEWR